MSVGQKRCGSSAGFSWFSLSLLHAGKANHTLQKAVYFLSRLPATNGYGLLTK